MFRTTRPIRFAACCLLLLAMNGCQLARDLLPRTHTTSISPDGRYLAFVRQHLNPDPPDDHLYLGSVNGNASHLMALAPDADSCRTIVWSPDSRMVGFLVNDQRLAVFDTRTRTHVATTVLIAADGYPGSQEARQVSLANDGTITFERVVRATILLSTRTQGTIEVPVTRSGTYGRPVRSSERSLGIERLHVGGG